MLDKVNIKKTFLNIKEKCFILETDFFGKAKFVV
jgi:hypothetical protein